MTTTMFKRLFSLNLALLLTALLAVPAAAQEPTLEEELQALMAAADTDLREAKTHPEREEDVSLLANTAFILDGGTAVSGDADASGTGWSYTASNNRLTLTDAYGGDPISVYTGLNLYVDGTVTINGANGSDAIYHKLDNLSGADTDDYLTVRILSGSQLTLKGGDGSTWGGSGIYSNYIVNINCQGTLILNGGDADTDSFTNDAGELEESYAGDGIFASGIILNGSGITSTGGNINSYSTEHGLAGCGIYGRIVYVRADCTLQGGYSNYDPGPGLYYTSSCTFGFNTITMINGGTKSALLRSSTASAYTLAAHTTMTRKSSSNYSTLYIKPNSYGFRMSGEPGWYKKVGTATFSSLEPYPTTYNLADYSPDFFRDNYALVAWEHYTSGEVFPLNATYTPESYTLLEAVWVSATPTALVTILNGLDGKLSGDQLYRRFEGKTIELPSTLTYEDDNILLGWSSQIAPKADSTTGLLGGLWYEGGDIVAPSATSATLLYAQSAGEGQYALYHPNGGTFTSGGTLLVQGSKTAGTMTISAPDASCVTAPEGMQLAGWATSADAAAARYEPGDSVILTKGTVTHLYAKWEPKEYIAQFSGLTITHCPGTGALEIAVPGGWDSETGTTTLTAALFNSSGKALSTAVAETAAEATMELAYTGEIPTLRIFRQDEDYLPVGDPLEPDLASIT